MSNQPITLDQFGNQSTKDADNNASKTSPAAGSHTTPETESDAEANSNSDDSDTVANGEIDLTEDVKKYLIKDQMGALIDALREAGQNGIDSPGSDRVLITVTPERSTIIDNGDGVELNTSEDQKNLTVLGAGTKSRSDDNTIGEWGIGKGAILARGAARIWSRGYELFFDYEDQRSEGAFADASGTDWAIREADHYLDGLMVEIDHYEDEVPETGSYKWSRYESQLEKRFRYTSLIRGVEIVINGESVNAGQPSEALDAITSKNHRVTETDEAHIAIEYSNHGSLEIYSNGVYVTDADIRGVSGVVVTKRNLTLNFARNAIQERCETWASIEDDILTLRTEIFKAMADSQLGTTAREAMVELMQSNESLRQQWADRKLFTLANEQSASLREIESAPEISLASKNTKGADKLVERGYLILDENDQATKDLQEHDAFSLPQTFDAEKRAVEEEVWSGYTRIEDESTLNSRQQHQLLFARALCNACGNDRSVFYGEAEVAAWTDGSSHITLTDSATTSNRREIWMHEIYIILMHELSHKRPDKDQPGHGHRFGERYYNSMENSKHWTAYRELAESILDSGFEDAFRESSVSIKYS